MTARKNHDIEALRAFAIILTLIAHSPSLVPSWKPWVTYFWFGGGVDLFFAVSGFLITSNLLELADEGPAFEAYGPPFWTRRVFRLWPAAMFWATTTLLLSLVLPYGNVLGGQPELAFSWLASGFQLQNLFECAWIQSTVTSGSSGLWAYWSLSLEEQFYFILPLVIWCLPNRRLLTMSLLILAVPQFFADRPYGSILWFLRTDALIYGTVVAILWHECGSQMRHLAIWGYRKIVAGAIVLLALCLMLATKTEIATNFMGIIALSAGGILFLVSPNQDYLTSRPIVRKIADYIGARSYSMYLIHYPTYLMVNDTLSSLFPSDGAMSLFHAGIGVLSVLALAHISYRYIEAPLRDYGRELGARMRDNPGTRIHRQA